MLLLLTVFLAAAFVSTACEPHYGEMEDLASARSMALQQRAPQWFPGGDHIAFNYGRAVYVIDSAGSRLTRVDGGGSKFDVAYAPSVSPDGSRIAYADYSRKNWEIVTARPDGSDQRRITDNDTHDISPVWSSNGTAIVFLSRLARSPSWGISIVAREGSGTPSTPVRVPASYPTSSILVLSPDGGHVAFRGFEYGEHGLLEDLYASEADGSGLTKLAEDTGMPSWSPDSRRIAFATREVSDTGYPSVAGVYTIGRDGSELRGVISLSGRGIDWTESLDWSPDGSAILVGSHVVAADGSSVWELSVPRGYGSWSPDGSRLAFYHSGPRALLYTVASDGSDSRVLVEEQGEDRMAAAGGRPLTPHEGG